MNIPKNKNEKTNEIPFCDVTSFQVDRAQVVNNSVTIDLWINGIKIYGCWVRQTKSGKDFISFPQRKGTDGKYYSIAFCKLSNTDTEAILKVVEDMIN